MNEEDKVKMVQLLKDSEDLALQLMIGMNMNARDIAEYITNNTELYQSVNNGDKDFGHREEFPCFLLTIKNYVITITYSDNNNIFYYFIYDRHINKYYLYKEPNYNHTYNYIKKEALEKVINLILNEQNNT